MKILFFSHYFPPEVNAPAHRTFEHCRAWASDGHEVHLVTCVPSHPAGVPFPGYRAGWYQKEMVEGIHVHRVWTYLAPNRGALRRTLSFLSYIPSAVFRSLRIGSFDILIATSPQFFCAVAGWLAALLNGRPWLFELRDIWPESISAVGAMKSKLVFKLLERLELFLYRRARGVVCLTRSFIENLAGRGIPRQKLHFIPNGIEPGFWSGPAAGCRERLGVGASDVVFAYVGTVGMAHGLGTILDVATRLRPLRKDVKFLIVGDGAERVKLEGKARELGLTNVIFTGLVPHDEARDLLASSDAALVLLRKTKLFETVIPSKMLEAFATGRPVILGVAGEARQILEEADAGIAIDPEDSEALARAVDRLASESETRKTLGENGRSYVLARFNRRDWAATYLRLVAEVASRPPAGAARPGP